MSSLTEKTYRYSQKSTRSNMKINWEFKNWIKNNLLSNIIWDISCRAFLFFFFLWWQELIIAVRNYLDQHTFMPWLLACFVRLIIKLFQLAEVSYPPFLIYEDPPILPILSFSNFYDTAKPLPTIFVVSFLWQNGWLCQIWCVILLNDIMNLHVLSLVPSTTRVLWCVLCNRASVNWDLTYDVTSNNEHVC